MTRRDFLRNLAVLGIGLNLGLPSLAGPISKKEKRLVVIHLFGGNDGLNTVVPVNDPLYCKLRPQLRLSPSACWSGGQGLHFHPALKPLQSLWEKGRMAVINGVGYPESNHSHFISSDIWHGGGPDQALGWLGRAADLADLPTMQLARNDQARALWAQRRQPLCLDPDQQPMEELDPLLHQLYGDHEDAHLRSTFSNMIRLEEKLKSCRCPGEKMQGQELALSLRWILELLPEARVFHTTMSGFDTHSEQLPRHHQALDKLARALADFYQGLEQRGWADSTTVMVFSEFGRRVAENGSGGTDHGTAGPVFLLGNSVKGGWLGEYPSLSQLDEGDLRHHVDFRQVYGGILEDWLELDPQKILGDRYAALRCFS